MWLCCVCMKESWESPYNMPYTRCQPPNEFKTELNALTWQKQNADHFWRWRIHSLQYLFEWMMLVLVWNTAAGDKIWQPEGVKRVEVSAAQGLVEPVLPKVEVFVVDHAAHALWVIFESCERDDIALTIQNRDGKISRFNKLQNSWVRINSIIGIVFAYLLQIDNLIGIVWICSPQNDSFIILLVWSK